MNRTIYLRLVCCLIAVLCLLPVAQLSAAPSVSNIRIDAVSYSSARVTWDTSGGTVSNYLQRIRYGLTTSYEQGSGGGILFQRNLPIAQNYQMALSGLAAGTVYHICPQVTDDNGSTWSSCVDATFTTQPRPAVSPALPVPPVNFSTAYPDTASYTVRNIAADCSNLQAEINNAVQNQSTNGSVILIPAGTVCHAAYTTPTDPDAKTFTSTNVDTANSRITISNHGYSDGQAIRVARINCLPGSSPGVPDVFCQLRGSIIQGKVYYIRNPTTDDFQVSESVNGDPITLSDQGSGTNAVSVWPPSHSNWVVIRTATPDAQFCPEGVRCIGEQWASRMPKFEVPGGTFAFDLAAFTPGIFAHHIRFTGLDVTHSDASASQVGSPDPRPTYALLNFETAKALSYITIDRSYVHGLGYPNRIYRPISGWDGKFMAIVDSDLSHWDFWRPGKTGWGVVIAGSTVTVSPGTYQLTATSSCIGVAPVTFTRVSGSGSATSFIYVGLDCTPTLVVPNGTSASCAGTVLNGTTGAARPCAVVTSALPAFPRDGVGSFACGTIAQIDSNGSSWTNAYDPYGYMPSNYITEGTQGMIGGWGPGPYKLENNYSEGAGLLWHFDDSAGKRSVGNGYTIRRNSFVTQTDKRTNGTGSKGLRYVQRNGIEWKNGINALIEGNTWDGFFADVSSTGCAITLTGIGGGKVSDFTIRYNTIRDSSCFLLAIGGLPWPVGITEPFQHLHVHDNLLVNLNGWTNYEPQARSFGHAFPFYIGYAMEDIIIDHNTVYDNRGPSPHTFHWISNPISGVSITNNILWVNNDDNSQGMSQEIDSRNFPFCNFSAKTLMDCLLRDGVGNASYTFSNNLLVPFFANSQLGANLIDPATTRAAYNGLSNVWVADAGDVLARLGVVGFADPLLRNFRLRSGSSYRSGKTFAANDGKDLGPDIDVMEAIQGRVKNVRELEIGNNSARIQFFASDSIGCAVDYSTSRTFTNFIRKENAGGSRKQQVMLDNLSPGTQYYYRVLCQVEQPQGAFSTLP